MRKEIIILGSTGSIGSTALKILKKEKNYKIKLLTAKKNISKLLRQSINFKVKNAIIEDKDKFKAYEKVFKKNRIKLHLGSKNINKIIKKKIYYCINAITGIDGLEPTLKSIPLTKNILIANKESIICGWDLINKKLKKNNTTFIPLDSEHFSINQLIKDEKREEIDKIILTASGGPFLNVPKNKILNIKPKFALKHPNWKMGKKISIDSSTMMNKIFEFIEAKKIFNLKNNKLSILIHPSSYVHAIVYFKSDLIKFLAHDTSMIIPISNALNIKINTQIKLTKNKLNKLNTLNFQSPKINKFPLLKVIKLIPEKSSYFETILITINDVLVNNYLNNKINYHSIQKNLLNFIKNQYFKKYYKLKPKNIYDIKKMIVIVKKYLEINIKNYEK